MALVVFFEKPGCINNTRQKQILAAAGHQVDARNILTEPWTVERLLDFFGKRPVSAWFNRSAPQVKNGAVVPDRCGAEEALALMLDDPLLIRRPLMAVGDRMEVGFDEEVVKRWIGLGDEIIGDDDLENCPRER